MPHAPETEGGMNLAALLVWIEDRRSVIDHAPDLVALAQTLAGAIDEKPDAQLAREYRMTLQALREIGSGDDDGEVELDARLRTSLRDPKGPKS